MQFKFKKDKFKNARGSSRLLELRCRKCDSIIVLYQKDGPGSLLRLYLDRIVWPENLINLQKKNLGEIKMLKCPKCGEPLGTPYIYPPENRKAFRLFQDSLNKKVKKL